MTQTRAWPSHKLPVELPSPTATGSGMFNFKLNFKVFLNVKLLRWVPDPYY